MCSSARFEREAKAQRDLLESYLAKYREANTRENIEAAPADGRIISRASVSNTPAYPKKLPIVLIATLATLLLTSRRHRDGRAAAHDRTAGLDGLRVGDGSRSGISPRAGTRAGDRARASSCPRR